jgi:hypothetical protein
MSPERSFDAFRVLDREERAEHLDRYRAWLRRRDGEPDARARTLSSREPAMQELERANLRWRGALDVEGFARCLAGHRRERLDARTEWVLAVARSNEGERYGLETELRRYLERGHFPGVPCQEIMVRVMLQESYHCRILRELWRTAGLDFEPGPPAWPYHVMMGLIASLPSWTRWVPVMAGELVGTSAFKVLHANVSLFAEQPEVEEHFRRLIREIWVDEVLHVAYLRAVLGRAGLIAVRALLPVIAFGVLHDVPQLRKLGCTPRKMVQEACRGVEIPAEIDWLAPDEPGDAPVALPVPELP